LGRETGILWPFSDNSQSFMIRPESRQGRGCNRTLLTMLKIAVAEPMPSASINTAAVVAAGDLRNMRTA
jgi:hypothetical protein